jgi:hypothetical protein
MFIYLRVVFSSPVSETKSHGIVALDLSSERLQLAYKKAWYFPVV